MPHPIVSHLALPVLASALIAGAGDDLKLLPEALAVGVELELFTEVVYELDFEIEAAGETLPGFEMRYERMREKTITVLEAGRHGPEAIRVVYHAAEELGEGPGIDGSDEVRAESPLAGEVVTVQRDGRSWTFLGSDDQALDEELAALVLDEEVLGDELLFAVRVFVGAVSGVALERGVTIDVDEDLVGALFDAALDEDRKVFEDAELVLTFTDVREHRETERRCAVFQVAAVSTGELPGALDVALKLAGELWLDLATACVTKLELAGEMAVAGESEDEYGVELEGEGTFRLTLRAL